MRSPVPVHRLASRRRLRWPRCGRSPSHGRRPARSSTATSRASRGCTSTARRSTDALVESKNGGHPQAARTATSPAAVPRRSTQRSSRPISTSTAPGPHRRSRPQGPRAQALPRRRHHRARRGRVRDERQRSRAGARRGPHARSGPSTPTAAAVSQARGLARALPSPDRRRRLASRSNTDGQRCRRARIAGARHRLQAGHQARAPDDPSSRCRPLSPSAAGRSANVHRRTFDAAPSP